MKKIIFTVATVLTFTSLTQASQGKGEFYAEDMSAMTAMSSLFPLFLTGYTTYGTMAKEIVDAREDINYFVASEGQVRTARLEAALTWTRNNANTADASDMEIAEELLAALGDN